MSIEIGINKPIRTIKNMGERGKIDIKRRDFRG